MDRFPRAAKDLLAGACYLALLALTFQKSYCTSGFLVFGLGSVLLLDRTIFQLLPWAPVALAKEVAIRAGYFVLGAAGYCLAHPGMMAWGEILYLGAAVSLAAFVFESIVGVAARVIRRMQGVVNRLPRSWPRRIFVRSLFLGLVVCVLPLMTLHLPCTLPALTPDSFGLAFEDVEFPTSDGLQLGGWLVPCSAARGSVIFCHGHGQNRGQVAAVLPALHALGLNVLAFDFRGHGESPGHTATFGHREVQDVLAAEAFLYERYPDKPIVIVGVSYGAAVSLQALPLLTHVQAVWSEGCFSRLETLINDKLAFAPAFLREPCIGLYNGLAWLDCGFLGTDINPIQNLSLAHVPICFCHGCRDELVPLAQAQALYDAYRGPKIGYWVAGAGHDNISRQAGPEYLRRLGAFFDQVLGKGTSARANKSGKAAGL